MEWWISLLLIEAESQRMTEHLAQQPGLQMPDVPGPDLFGLKALHQLTEDGLDAVTGPAELVTPPGPGVFFLRLEGGQQGQALATQLLTQGWGPVVAVAQQDPLGVCNQFGDHGQVMPVGRGQAEPVINPGQFRRRCTLKP